MERVAARAGLGWLALALTANALAAPLSVEQQWLAAADQFERGHLTEAEKSLRSLLQQQPNFRLARWLYGDLLAARSGKKIKAPAGAGEIKAQDLLDEARLRLQERRTLPPADAVPDALLQPGGGAKYWVVTDLSRSRVFLLENKKGTPRLLRSYYAGIARNGIGKQTAGDLRTPVGIYHVTGFTPDRELPEIYGVGAFPLSYPNAWDRRQQRTGSGIWLHGVPRVTYVRSPRSSKGCVTLANDDLLALKPYLLSGKTPVILSEKVNWIAAAPLEAARKDFLGHLEAWRQAWASKDTARYLAYYAADFVSDDGMNRAQFAAFKQRVNASKKFIQLQIGDIEAYRYPGETGLVVTRFKQDYRSDNMAKVSRKEQFWRRGKDGQWKIVSEETL